MAPDGTHPVVRGGGASDWGIRAQGLTLDALPPPSPSARAARLTMPHSCSSGSNDGRIKFWTRNRPGDLMEDNYSKNQRFFMSTATAPPSTGATRDAAPPPSAPVGAPPNDHGASWPSHTRVRMRRTR